MTENEVGSEQGSLGDAEPTKMGGLEQFIAANTQTILDRIEGTLIPDPMGVRPHSPHQFCSIPRPWMEQLVKLARASEAFCENEDDWWLDSDRQPGMDALRECVVVLQERT